MHSGGGLAVTTTVDLNATLELLRDENIAQRLADKDATLWGPDAEDEASIRLGWVDTFTRSRDLLPQVTELKQRLASAGINRVVLCGMGGSSLAPEVICRTLDLPLTVVDTTDPQQVAAAMGDDLSATVVVIASKSGSTVETDSHRRVFEAAFTTSGIEDTSPHFVYITDEGSQLDQLGTEQGVTVFRADANVGGRYSALTAFGLVPSALAGADIEELIDQAEEFATTITSEEDNPALLLGAAIAECETMTFAADGSGIVGLGDWAEQLIAESTGKDGKGTLPVVVEYPGSPGARGEDRIAVSYGGSASGITPSGSRLDAADVAVNGPLGAHFLCWELATAYAGRLIGIDPFNQPNVTESKENTNRILSAGLPEDRPDAVDGAVQIFGSTATTVTAVIQQALDDTGNADAYLAVMAYLDRKSQGILDNVRPALAEHTAAPVTFGWGPRFLHSTGQFHKGGRQSGVFVQITGSHHTDLDIPGRDYTFATLQTAQAAGDRQAILERNRPFIRLHLTDRSQGIEQILEAVKGLATS
ncbi:glucose-6-phosphate isomerase [Natronoglycomyces albus]|uniref:Glucose-6-phosphate isomerase n=2 Tax=Natronoglycomyces albus TaxID=2811108 RepID=A0A895XU62_9ACTN|nr:glucose-6-phosphate isomerase [Natronoglycomyces albus]